MEDVIGRRRRRAGRALAWAAVGAWAATIFWFSSRTGTQLPRHWLLSHDKLCHAAEYGLLGALLCHALWRSGLARSRAFAVAALLALAYGVGDEYHQGFVAGRQGNDPFDVAADAVGGATGALGFALAAGSGARGATGSSSTDPAPGPKESLA